MTPEENQQVIEKIYEIVRWLEQNGQSQAITEIVIHLDELAIQAMWLSEAVSEAYAERNRAEEEYKYSLAKSISESKESVAKAEKLAVVQLAGFKKEFLVWDNLYQKLKLKMDRIDVVLDSHRQRVSLLKQMDLKHGNS